jgi:hypothetical protein
MRFQSRQIEANVLEIAAPTNGKTNKKPSKFKAQNATQKN